MRFGFYSTFAALAFTLASITPAVTSPQFAQRTTITPSEERRDRFGISMASSGETLVVGAPLNDRLATEAGAAFVYTRNPIQANWIQQASLTAINPGHGDRFGSAVAIDGDTMLVGAPYEDSSEPSSEGIGGFIDDDETSSAGAVYVFGRETDDETGEVTWRHQAYIKAPVRSRSDYFGYSVAISGDTIIVGSINETRLGLSPGGAHVYVRGNEGWRHQASFFGSLLQEAQFGLSVAIDGDLVVVGAPGETTSTGAAYLFERSGEEWQRTARLTAPVRDRRDQFGWSVSTDGETIAIGADGEDSPYSGIGGNMDDNSLESAGAVYLFDRSDGEWGLRTFLKASNPQSSASFGNSVMVEGDRLVVGAPNESGGGSGVNSLPDRHQPKFRSGSAYLFVREDGEWRQTTYFKSDDPSEQSGFGSEVTFSGESVLVSVPHPSSTTRTGAVHVFDPTVDTIPHLSSISKSGESILVTIPPAFGLRIGVEYSPDLSPGSWIELGNFFDRGASEWIFVDSDPVRCARASGYYRAFPRSPSQ